MFSRIVALTLLGALLLGAGSGCRSKPSDEDCKRAVANLQRLNNTGTGLAAEKETAAAVRRCLADSTMEDARCVAAAQTVEAADTCLKKK